MLFAGFHIEMCLRKTALKTLSNNACVQVWSTYPIPGGSTDPSPNRWNKNLNIFVQPWTRKYQSPSFYTTHVYLLSIKIYFRYHSKLHKKTRQIHKFANYPQRSKFQKFAYYSIMTRSIRRYRVLHLPNRRTSGF